MQENIDKLSNIIVDYSLEIKKGDRVLITYQDEEIIPLVKNLIMKINAKEGIPFTKLVNNSVDELLNSLMSEERALEIRKQREFQVNAFDCFITIRYITNDYEASLVPSEYFKVIGDATKDIDRIKINERRWVLLNYPSKLDAYKAKMPTDNYFNFAFNTMVFDYKKMSQDIQPLKELMEKTDKVRIVAPATDLTFSIKNIPVIPCCGKCNIPDGEVFTAPIKNSVNGTITYNTPSPYYGEIFNNVKLTFSDGKIVECSCNPQNDKLLEIFNTDEGARYIGEFSLGINPLITKPIGDILYDEKIIGSLHFTPGRCYDEATNGNDSSIHWDMVLIQRKEYGGGEIYFDGELVRKDGLFVKEELKHLNYNLN
ncbi:MAG: aminopeptidase [Bacilli bacterium]